MKKLLYDLPLNAYLPTYLKCGGCHMDASAFLQRQMRLQQSIWRREIGHIAHEKLAGYRAALPH